MTYLEKLHIDIRCNSSLKYESHDKFPIKIIDENHFYLKKLKLPPSIKELIIIIEKEKYVYYS